jgi:shikimate dehydrogenase
MTDRYAVIGNPVEHSRSPAIHAAFARATGQDLRYERLLAPLDGFARTVDAFRAAGGRGCNVTLPFKREAWQYAPARTRRAELAEAVNTLRFDATAVHGDNTDGAGLIRDITVNLGVPLAGARVLLIGAGGAASGVVLPLLEAGVSRLVIVNRTAARAHALAARFAAAAGDRLAGGGWDAAGDGHTVLVNATAASLAAEVPPLPAAAWDGARLAYDMMYADEPTPFLDQARRCGVRRIADGIGMLVEQAAESFLVWRGVRPSTEAVLGSLLPAWRR